MDVTDPPAARPTAHGSAVNGRAAVTTLIYLGFTLQLLQAGIVPLLPALGRTLRLTTVETSWLLTAQLVSGAILLTVLTRLADLLGKRRIILLALALVLLGCLIGSVADSYGTLLAGRVLMGALMPMLALPEAIASDTMSKARAHFAIGAIHAGTGLGIAGGILLGALVGLHPALWHVFFYVGAVATALGIAATLAFVRESGHRADGGLDVRGAVILTVALVSVLLGLSEGPSWGWASGRVIGLLAGGCALTGVWWVLEDHTEHPLVRVSALVNPRIRVPYALTFLTAFGVYGSLSAVTRLAQSHPAVTGFGYGWGPLRVAWFALPQAIGSILAVVVLQRMAHRTSHIVVSACGLALNTAAFALFAAFHAQPGVVLAALGCYALGTGVVLAATQLMVLREVAEQESGIALGLSIVMYAVGNSLGSAVVGVLFAALTTAPGLPALGSYTAAFWVCGGATALGLLLCVPQARRTASGPSMPLGPEPAVSP